MKYIKKVEARAEGVHFVMQALFQTLGNKRYLHDLEKLLNDRLTELISFDEETLHMLGRDILALR